jgi:hypothetical protein
MLLWRVVGAAREVAAANEMPAVDFGDSGLPVGALKVLLERAAFPVHYASCTTVPRFPVISLTAPHSSNS